MVAKEIAQRPKLGLVPAGFVDYDPSKPTAASTDWRSGGTIDDLERRAQTTNADEAILTMASSPVPTSAASWTPVRLLA